MLSTLDGYHRPKYPLPPNPNILDLGSNVGYTLRDFAAHFPGGRIIGVEMDVKNYQLAVANTRFVKGIEIVNCAVAARDGEVYYKLEEFADAYAIEQSRNKDDSSVCVQAATVQTLTRKVGIERIDYLKMVIEGEEIRIFSEQSDLEWLTQVQQMNIEVHGSKTNDPRPGIISVLEHKGFKVEMSSLHWSSLRAIRDQAGEGKRGR